MIHKLSIIAFILSFTTFHTISVANASANNDWALVKEKNNIQIFTKKSSTSPIKNFKGITVVQANISEVFNLLKDIPGYANWMPDCKESKVLDKSSDNEFYQYTITDAPWPISDRDSVMKTKISEQSNGTITISLSAAPNHIPEKSGLVRVPTFEGYWELIPQASGSTKIIYEGQPSAGGSIPAWLANSAAVDVPFNTLSKMKEILE